MPSSAGGPSGNHPAPSFGFGSPGGLTPRHRQLNQSVLSSASPASSSALDDGRFDPEMRDRQARGKDPYQSDDGDLSDGEGGTATKLRLGTGRAEKQDFARIERRQRAIAFLDNPELLMMYAQSTGDSIAAARLHFTKQLCGYEDGGRRHDGTQTANQHSRRDRENVPTPERRRGGGAERRAGAN